MDAACMGRIKMLAPLVPKGDGRTVKPEPKQVDPFYHSAGDEAFRRAVLSRAGFRCVFGCLDWRHSAAN